MSLSSSYAYGNPVHLADLTRSHDGYGNFIFGFSVFGGTNNVPFETLQFQLTGTDASLFDVNNSFGTTNFGHLKFKLAPDFELTSPLATSNVY